MQAAQDGDYTYTVTAGNAQITKYTGAGGTVTIPSTLGGISVTSIGNYAFKGCTNLTSISIPQGVISIGDSAFSYCEGLTSISIPKGVTSIGNWAFQNCKGLTSISIPEEVTSIGNYAFSGCTGLISISIPQGVTSIGDGAFSGCTGLISISIPQGVTSIGNNAFWRCEGLTSISIPEGVTSIGSGAFWYCTGLISISIPQGVTSIGNNAFSGCRGLTNITVAVNNLKYASIDGVLYNKEGSALIVCPGGLTSVSISPGVTSIGDNAFSSCRVLTSVIIPPGVTSIGDGAFEYCTGLTSISIPQEVTSIGDGAFSGCTGLTSISIPKGVTSIGDGAFRSCNGLTNISIPEGVTSIGYDVFYNCTSLTNISIPESVTSIDYFAFWSCRGLTSISIPQGVTSIGGDAFGNCTGLTVIKFNSATTTISDYADTIPSTTKIIGYDPSTAKDYAAKYGRTFEVIGGSTNTLQSIAITTPATKLSYTVGDTLDIMGLVVTGTYSDGSTKAESITVANITGFNSAAAAADQVLTITVGAKTATYKVHIAAAPPDGDYTYTVTDGKAQITSYTGAGGVVTIPSMLGGAPVTSIGYYAFWNCKGLTRISISQGVTSIGGGAFESCTGLTSVSIPQGLTSIGDGAFGDCTGLTSISIPQGVTSIGDYALSRCTGLTSIIVDDANLNYASIDGVLYNKTGTILLACPGGLNSISISIPETVTSIGNGAFGDCTGLTSISIPQGVTSIGNYAFSGCIGLSAISIPETVTSIGNGAFGDCTGLTSINLPQGVASIGDRAFWGCEGLTSISIPQGLTSIGSEVFAHCRSLTRISIPEGITSIGSEAFLHCTGLTTIGLPQGVTSIGDYAFLGCTGLTSIIFNSATTTIYDSPNPIPTTTKIIGYNPSTAKDYATKYNRTFEVIDTTNNPVNNVEDNPFSYGGYIPSNITIPETSVNEITDISQVTSNPYTNNIVTSTPTQVYTLPGDLKVVNTNLDTNGVSFTVEGDIFVENGTFTVSRSSKITARNITIGHNGVVVVDGKLYINNSVEMYGGGSSDTPGGNLIIRGSNDNPFIGNVECSSIRIKDYARLMLGWEATLVVRENMTVQNKVQNDLESGNIWIGGNFLQKNGGWFNQGADNFQPRSGLSVILYNTYDNRYEDKEHKLEFQSKDQSWLNNFYIEDTVWSELENKTRSVKEKNVTMKGKSAVVQKLPNVWNFALVNNSNSEKTKKATITSIIQKINQQEALITYGIPELGAANSESNKAIALVASALANLHHTKTAATGIFVVYSELYAKVRYTDEKSRDIKLTCQGTEIFGATAVKVEYSLDGGEPKFYGAVFKADSNQLYDDLYSYATDNYIAAIAELIQVPLLNMLTWDLEATEKALTEYAFNSLRDSLSGSIVELSFAKPKTKSMSSLESFPITSKNNMEEKIAFKTSLLSESITPYGVSPIQDMGDNLKKAICEALNVQNFEDITPGDLATIERLDLTDRYITSLAGLEQLVNLETLSMSGNAVTDLSPIANLTKLNDLDFSGNTVNSLAPLNNLINLTNLKMANNYCSELSPLANLHQLETLDISNNNVSTIGPLTGLTGLKTLYLYGNALDNKNLDALTELDSLQTLAASSCNLETIEALSGKPLLFLDVSSNRIADISKLNSGMLQTVNLSGNLISDISSLGQMSELLYLDFSDNQVSTIAGIASLNKLISLYLSNNPIADITAIENLLELETLDCGNLEVTNFEPIVSLSKLKELGICNTRLVDLSFLTGKNKLQKVTLSHCYLDDVSAGALSARTSLQEVDLSYNFISDLTILTAMTDLHTINLSDNYIKDLTPLTSLLRLKNLNLDNNDLADSSSNQTVLADILSRSGNVSTETKNVVLREVFLPDEITIYTGQIKQLTPMIIPSNASNQTVSWTSDNPSVASVDQNGNVTAVSVGNTVITVTTQDGGYTASCVVTATLLTPEIITGVPIVQIGVNPNDSDSLGIFIGLDNIMDSSGNTSNLNVAGYQIEIDYDPTKVNVLDVIDEAHMGQFTKSIDPVARKVIVTVETTNGTSNYSKLFFIPITLTGSAFDSTSLQVKYIYVRDTNLNQISVENPTDLVFHRGKIYNEGSGIQPSITDAVAGLQYLAGLKNAGTDLGQVNPINMASIVGQDVSSTVIKSSVKDIIALMQYLVNIRDPYFTVSGGGGGGAYTTPSDKILLTTAIGNATTLIGSKTVGAEVGDVSQAAHDAFQASIVVATAVKNDASATQTQVNAQVTALGSAMIAFNNASII